MVTDGWDSLFCSSDEEVTLPLALYSAISALAGLLVGLYKHSSANSLTSVEKVSIYWACSLAQYVEKNSFSSKTSSWYHHQVFLNTVLMTMILHRKAALKSECLWLKLLQEKVIEAAAFSVVTKLCRTIYMEITEVRNAFFASVFTGEFFSQTSQIYLPCSRGREILPRVEED